MTTAQAAEFARYLEDASGFQGQAERVWIPEDETQLAAILRAASASRTPVTVAGAGTGVTGARVAQGGWTVSLERFRRLEIRPGSAMVGPGILLRELDAAARASGQFFAPDPTETGASLGGAIATNASGSRSFRYGSVRGHLLGLRAAFIDGSIRDFARGDRVEFTVPAIRGSVARKHSAGYPLEPGLEWIDLLAGSEGTLAIMTQAEVRLLAAPEALLAGVVFFGSLEASLEAVDAWRPIPRLRMLEFLDQPSLELLRPRFPEIPATSQAALLIEQELDSLEDPEIEVWLERLESAGALTEASWFGCVDRDRERFRVFRHALPEAVNDLMRRRGFLKLGSDYAVPPAANRAMLDYYRRRLEAGFPGRYVIFGHIGDAHLHVNILPETPEEFAAGQRLMLDFAREAVRLGGTVSAEHGLGKRKAYLLEVQYRAAEIEAMKAVKRRLDPEWLLGRGNLFSVESGA